jgi:hypothetical protein
MEYVPAIGDIVSVTGQPNAARVLEVNQQDRTANLIAANGRGLMTNFRGFHANSLRGHRVRDPVTAPGLSALDNPLHCTALHTFHYER